MLATAADHLLSFTKEAVLRAPGIREIRQQRYERAFKRTFGASRGVFASFEEARRSAPADKWVGFNHKDYPTVHLDRLDQLQYCDYPVLFWLSRIIGEHTRIFDLGGNVGVHYHCYKRYLCYPDSLIWLVCDIPEVTDAGKQIMAQRPSNGLAFTNSFEDASGADIMLAAGVIQYIDSPLSEMLAGLPRPPRHLFLNKLPLYDGEEFVTLQNGGPVLVPQRIFNRTEFLDGLTRLGYTLIDSWSVSDFCCVIPFHPERTVMAYTGLYLQMTDDPSAHDPRQSPVERAGEARVQEGVGVAALG